MTALSVLAADQERRQATATRDLNFAQRPHLQKVPLAQFGDLVFPVSEVEMSSAIRHHVHEYPHTPGGQLETMGRQVYRVRMTPVFDEGITSYDNINKGVPLYPDILNALHAMFEAEQRAQLVVPCVGSIDAVLTEFSRRQMSAILSGESVSLSFVQSPNGIAGADFSVHAGPRQTRASLAQWNKEMDEFIRKTNGKKTPADIDLIDQITNLANAVFAIADSAELFINQAADKVQALVQLVERADKKISFFKHPEAWRAVEAGKDLWLSAVNLKALFINAEDTALYVVPNLMTLADVSQAIYRDSSHGSELLKGNNIPDPLAIPAGTEIRYNIRGAV